MYGSLEKLNYLIDLNSDTLITFNHRDSTWHLIKDANYIYLNNEKILIYTKSSIFTKFKNEKDFENQIINYFHKNIFVGSYLSNNKNDTIFFNENGTLTNFRNFTNYEVYPYFGTLHPQRPFDVIYLIEKTKDYKSYKDYYWQFKNDSLILIEFVEKKIIFNNQEHISDDRTLGTKKLILQKINK
jgi:hypothetical protein